MLVDTETDRKLFYKKGFDSNDDIEELSSSNKVTLIHDFNENNFEGFSLAIAKNLSGYQYVESRNKT